MQKEINFYQEMASEHRLQEYCKGLVPFYIIYAEFLMHKKIEFFLLSNIQDIVLPLLA